MPAGRSQDFPLTVAPSACRLHMEQPRVNHLLRETRGSVSWTQCSVCTVETSLGDTSGTYHSVQYSEVSLSQGLLMYGNNGLFKNTPETSPRNETDVDSTNNLSLPLPAPYSRGRLVPWSLAPLLSPYSDHMWPGLVERPPYCNPSPPP